MEKQTLTLLDIPTGESCIVLKVNGHGGFRHRIMELGFSRGVKIEVIKNAPLLDPIEYKVLDSYISLRRSEAQNIEVINVPEDLKDSIEQNYYGMFSEMSDNNFLKESGNTINVALVGNPNCGKTSFFNHATGLHEHVGNYAGVTVDSKVGTFYHRGYTINLVDLPGTYSITEYSPEELYVRKYIVDEHPDVVLNIVDASNLERNLFLTTQLIDMNLRVVMALNMYDELEKSGAKFDYNSLGSMLGIPIIPTMAHKGEGIESVLENIVEMYEDKSPFVKHIHINYGEDIEKSITSIRRVLGNNTDLANRYPNRYIALKLLEGDSETQKELASISNINEVLAIAESERKFIETSFAEDISSVINNAKYGFIRGALNETYERADLKNNISQSIDTILTNKWAGIPILILFVFLMFVATFDLGAYPQGWIDSGVSYLSDWLSDVLPEGMFTDLIVDGIIAGVGGVLVFLPNVLILFFFISIMEDTGYMARAAFLMDKIMHKIGLHGKSFIPIIMGFGCAVPAIMATRTLENRRDRIITMLVVPFMSCPARLPVYLLLVAAFFTKYQALVLFSIYLIGVVIAVLTAGVLSKTILKGKSDQFVMELPPYRIPTVRNTLLHMWNKSVQYLQKMGTVILLASIIIWALEYFPRNEELLSTFDEQIASVENSNELTPEEKEIKIEELSLDKLATHSEHSYIGQLGHFIEPVVRPLGFDWKMGVSLISGLAAKEIVVSTMGILYHADEEADEESNSLVVSLQSVVYTSGSRAGQKVYSPLVAYTFMLFVLLYFPCIAALTSIAREGSKKWMLFELFYTLILAWLVSFLVYQVGQLPIQSILTFVLVMLAVILVIYKILKPKNNCSCGCSNCSAKDKCNCK